MAHRTIFVDPDGTNPGVYVIVAHPTGVLYGQPYGGTANLYRELEGYLVPVDGTEASAEFHGVFEVVLEGTGIGGQPSSVPEGVIDAVVQAVERIQFWPSDAGAPESLRVDMSKIRELDEGWVPVLTSDGPAGLIWPNSD